jgi:isoleucyl-tRNA synthetase
LGYDEVIVQAYPKEGLEAAGSQGLVVALDTEITPELAQEGLAREIVRRIQDLRKQADYQLTDRIVVRYAAEGGLTEAIVEYADEIKDEVLAAALEAVEDPTGDEVLEDEVEGHDLTLAVERV